MAVSKITRFEVFKRDAFTCQYCGKTPPIATLELDHIKPKAHGGKDSIDNYITACHDCNNGKGVRELSSIPPSLNDRIGNLQERRIQLKEYSKYLADIDAFYDNSIKRISKIFNDTQVYWKITEFFNLNTLRYFIKHIPTNQVEDAMILACSRSYSPRDTIKYFCGVCWKTIRDSNNTGNRNNA
jgi:hypothetical protein